jgi:protein ImuB
MKSRAGKSATADLFAAADAAARQPVPAPMAASPPPREAAARPSPKRLWYAVVFPQLNEAQQSAAVLRRLCLHAQRFTSLVSIEMPNALLLEIRGSVKLFGSLEMLHAGIDAAWSRLKLCAHSATAPSALAALWFARAGKRVRIEDGGFLAGELAELPVACTSWDAERLHTLRAMGVTRVGDLLRLPRAGMARRFGRAAVLDMDIALARQDAPRRAFVPRERFCERCDFEAEIEAIAYLQKALEPLIGRCAKFLRERQAGVLALELRLRHRARPATRMRVGLASVTSEHRRLTDVMVQKLSRLELAAPILGMELLSGTLQPLSAGSLDAFAALGGACGRDAAPQLVERLRARLGEAAVYGIRSIPEHRPEAAWQRIHELHLGALRPEALRPGSGMRTGGRMIDLGMADEGMPRPVWLLGEPVMLLTSEVQQLHQGEGILEEGPERIESGWWDGEDIARDYYIARHADGIRHWIFQEHRSKCWYLHGVFA